MNDFKDMEIISNQEFAGERPLYRRQGLSLENVKIGIGESALKETSDIAAKNCVFEGKYPLWECSGFTVKDCVFKEGARAGIWYSRDCEMSDTLYEAPKGFREMDGLTLRNIKFPNAQETLWGCRNVRLEDVTADNADYIFLHCENVKIRNFRLNGNYSFQYCENVEIRDSVLNTKDAFWQSENITVYDSQINGEYLAWYSKNLRLVRCRITQTQPLCYCENLILEDCEFGDDADLAFEYSSLQARIRGRVPSVKNPRTGFIKAGSIGQIIIDQNIKAPADCRIEQG